LKLSIEIKDHSKTYKVLAANIPTIIIERKFKGIPKIHFDLWFAAHASQFDLHKKHKEDSPYNPEDFIDVKSYQELLDEIKKEFIVKTNKEKD
jgi:metallo-beta-lactamase class B